VLSLVLVLMHFLFLETTAAGPVLQIMENKSLECISRSIGAMVVPWRQEQPVSCLIAESVGM
jgi:hypothetical protein